MISKDEFLLKANSNIGDDPKLEMLYQAKDPRLTQNIGAIATMLAMISQQIDVAQAEPFEKTRDSTVLADSAMRGIIPKSKPTILNILVENEGNTAVEIGIGRNIIDANGRILRVETGATIPAGESGHITVAQYYAKEIEHTITESKPFYAIQIDMQNDESTLCGLKVDCVNGCEYVYTDKYAGVGIGEQVYHIEVDDRKRFYIRFGYDGFVGTQPEKDEIFKISLFYSFGEITNYAVGDQLTFENYQGLGDVNLNLSIAGVDEVGEDPIGIDVLRELSKYPSVYNKNAVYLGEFDFLVRSTIPKLDFLFVWNEALEEIARGASVENINKLFVAVYGADGAEKVLNFEDLVDDEGNYLSPETIIEFTPLQERIKTLILNADDGYSLRFYTPVKRPISLNVKAKVSTAYDAVLVKSQIRELLLSTYGEGSLIMSKGKAQVSYMEIYDLLKKSIVALSVGRADLLISIEDISQFLVFPEIWHYLTDESMDIEVTNINVTTGSWGVAF